MLSEDRHRRLQTVVGEPVQGLQHLTIGHLGPIMRLVTASGRRLVVKIASGHGDLCLEAEILIHLAAHRLPVPAVHHAEHDLLVMDELASGGAITASAERHAADLIAALHTATAPRYGFDRDTVIGPLPQRNPWSDDWIAFFRNQRLWVMAEAAGAEGRLDSTTLNRLSMLADRLAELLGEPGPPALIHGDLWGGNILVDAGRISGFIDPAIYYADPEIELAFSTLFGTFGAAFFDRYQEHRPLRPGFFEVRRDIYNLYPLLVHVRLFGGAYAAQVDRIARRFVG